MRVVLLNCTDYLGHHGCTLVNRQLRRFARKYDIEISAKINLHADWDSCAPEEFDAVIVNGEGTLHDSSKGAERIARIPGWAASRGKPAHLINTVYQDNSPEIAREISRFDSVYVRDELSRNALEKQGITCETAPDLALTWQAPVPQNGRSLVVNGSTIRAVRERLYRASLGHGVYLPILAPPVGDPGRLRRYRIKRFASFFSHPGARTARYRNALPEFSVFARFLQNHAAGILTGRFHMAIMALCLEIPVLAVKSNTHKMEALFGELGMPERVIDAESFDDPPDIPAYSSSDLSAIRGYRREAEKRADACFSGFRA